MLFAAPMCVLFFLGIFLSYLLVLKRENRMAVSKEGRLGRGLFEEPQPEILIACAVGVARLKAATIRHVLGLSF